MPPAAVPAAEHRLLNPATIMVQFLNEAAPLSEKSTEGDRRVISNQRYFERRASEEAARAARAMSTDAKLWHRELAEKFSRMAKD